MDIGHRTDEVDRREAPAEIGEIAGLDLANDRLWELACAKTPAPASGTPPR
jgi:hypothetical protein